MPEDKQAEYLYDDIHDTWQLHPRVIERECEDILIKEFRKLLKEYLDRLRDPFLWNKEREGERIEEV